MLEYTNTPTIHFLIRKRYAIPGLFIYMRDIFVGNIYYRNIYYR